MPSPVDHILECPLCTETALVPKLLACGHTLCIDCIRILLITAKHCNPYTNSIDCIICCTSTVIPEGEPAYLPDNMTFIQLKDLMKFSRRKVKFAKACDFCDRYQREAAQQFCKDCENHLCDRCALEHEQIDKFADHRLVQDIPVCEYHSNKYIYFCNNCRKLLCSICLQKTPCKEHSVEKLEELEFSKLDETEVIIEQLKLRLEKDSNEALILEVQQHLDVIREDRKVLRDQADALVREIRKNEKELDDCLGHQQSKLLSLKAKLEADDDKGALTKLLQVAEAAKGAGTEHMCVALPSIHSAMPEPPSEVDIQILDSKMVFFPQQTLGVGQISMLNVTPTFEYIDKDAFFINSTFTPRGMLAITNTSTKTVDLFDDEAKIVKTQSNDYMQIECPRGITFSTTHSALVVSDEKSNQLALLDPDDLLVTQQVTLEGIDCAWSVTCVGEYFVVTCKVDEEHKISVHDRYGKQKTSWEYPKGSSQNPGYVSTDIYSNIIVSSTDSVYSYDTEGKQLGAVTTGKIPYSGLCLHGTVLVPVGAKRKPYKLVACDPYTGQVRNVLVWDTKDTQEYGNVLSTAVYHSCLAVVGTGSIRLYKLEKQNTLLALSTSASEKYLKQYLFVHY